MTVGIIGLGIMGGAYARNLVAAGETVIGVDPLEDARERVAEAGGEAYAEPGSWIGACDLVILSLASPSILASVTTALRGLVKPGQIVLETGTFALADKEAARQTLAKADAILLDCPVSGTGAQAAKGDLVMMASGPGDAIEQARPLMEKFTRLVINAEPFGNGTRLKFVANHAVALHNAAAAETLHYADELGLDREMVYELLSSGAGQSRMSDLRMPLMMSGSYRPPTASLKMFEKDFSVIGNSLAEHDVKAPLFEAARRLYEQAFADLPEDYDAAAVFEIYQQAKARKD
ncbi:MAG: NAD(P)-dependent oxidoreductase [Geminicoccaceae bacterium]